MDRKQIWMSDRDYAAGSLEIMARAEPAFSAAAGPFDNRQSRGLWPTFTVAGVTGTYRFRPVGGTPTLTTAAVSLATTPDFYLDYNQYSYGLAQGAPWRCVRIHGVRPDGKHHGLR